MTKTHEDITESKKTRKILTFLRANFVAGLLIIAPAVITYQIVKLLVVSLDNFLIGVVPHQLQPESLFDFNIHGLGLIGGFFMIVFIGVFTRNFVGSYLAKWADELFSAIPGVRSIYGAVKQIVTTLGQSNSSSFREVVLVEYPRPGLWAIAFVTGKTKGEVQKITDDEMVNVFLPTTPNPTSGFLLFVPRKDLVTLHMSVDQGLKMVISGGIVTPTMTEGKAALKEQKHAERRQVQVEGDEVPKRRKTDKR